MFDYLFFLFFFHFLSDLQPSVAWIVDRMAFVKMVNVAVMLDLLEVFVINCRAMPDVPNMDNAKMEHVFVHRVGMDAIVLCVSFFYISSLSLFLVFFPSILQLLSHFSV